MTELSAAEKTYQELSLLRQKLETEVAIAASSGDFTFAKCLRDELEGKRAKLEQIFDPDQIKLRDAIAKEQGYNFVGYFSPSGIARAMHNQKYFYINKDGRKLSPKTYEYAESYQNGIAKITETPGTQMLSYLINENEEEISGAYKEIGLYSEKFIRVQDLNNNQCFLNKQGKEVEINYKSTKRTKFSKTTRFSEGVAWVFLNNKWLLLDTNLRIHDPENQWIMDPEPFSNGLAKVSLEREDLLGPTPRPTPREAVFVDKTGSRKFPTVSAFGFFLGRPITYSDANSFSEGLAWVKEGNKSGFIDTKGKMVIELPETVNAKPFSNGKALIYSTTTIAPKVFHHFIDTSNHRLSISHRGRIFFQANSFCEGLALLKADNNELFFIDIKGTIINQEGYLSAGDFHEGVAKVKDKNGNEFYIDKKGNRVFS